MSVKRNLLPSLGPSIDLRSLDKTSGNPWQKNTSFRNGRHEVRKGFGLLTDVSTTLTANRVDGGTSGYSALLGVNTRVTDQGHQHVTSVVKLDAFTANSPEDDAGTWISGSIGQTSQLLALVIHDVTVNATQEYILQRNTVESCTATTRLPLVLPSGQTQEARDLSSYITVDDTPAVSWATVLDELYVCVAGYGVWRIGSIDPSLGLNQQLDSYPGNALRAANCHGETGVVTRLTPQQGFFTDGLTYLSASLFGTPQAITQYENRLVYAINRTLLFSDPDFPQHILASNQQTIPSERPITALAVVKGIILAWTESETWLYQPQQDTLISGGRLYNLSRTIGCLSPLHTASSHEAALWMDRWGVYGCSGGTSIETLSGAIDPWFTQTDVQDPVSSHVWSANTTLSTTQPRARWSMSDEVQAARLAWDDRTSTLFASMPSMTLVWQQGTGWSTWGFDTTAGTTVTSTSAMGQPQISALEGRIFASSLKTRTYTDALSGYTFLLSSLSHYELGRGGAMDRSSTKQEDQRRPQGQWVVSAPTIALTPAMRIGEPVIRPAGWETSTGQFTTVDTYLLPLYISADAVDNWRFRFTINSDWRVLTKVAAPAGAIDFLLPNNRVPSTLGYSSGLGEVRAYNGGGAADNNGLNVRVYWDGAGVVPPNQWAFQPNMNLVQGRFEHVLYIPVIRLAGTTGDTVLDIVESVTMADLDPAGVNTPCQAAWWQTGSYPAQSLHTDSEAKSVDWALKTREMGDGKNQLLCRGSYTKLMSHGSATARPASATDVLNSLTTSDYQDFSGQVSSWAYSSNISAVQDKLSMRARMLSTTSIPATKVGNNVAKWGNTANTAQGNLLIDDPAVDTIAVSEGVQGEQFSTMLYGSLSAPAEALTVQATDIEVRVTGARRRGGR